MTGVGVLYKFIVNGCCFVFYSKVFHVRSVTQGDVIRADAKEIPKIFQVKINNMTLLLISKLLSCLQV
jgi:hypothetical protein